MRWPPRCLDGAPLRPPNEGALLAVAALSLTVATSSAFWKRLRPPHSATLTQHCDAGCIYAVISWTTPPDRSRGQDDARSLPQRRPSTPTSRRARARRLGQDLPSQTRSRSVMRTRSHVAAIAALTGAGKLQLTGHRQCGSGRSMDGTGGRMESILVARRQAAHHHQMAALG